ncbi:hypothetical protein IWW38_002626 [Coemansia aciculifera]|uniref:Uncharacterized protein n=1 Tax=Coemansia aciculifera TaxID=417176 RepID=A0ACC1M3Z5_9FUNG|nr:hypothetical protein IWW38_002626 [Coemansia aciculifera]
MSNPPQAQLCECHQYPRAVADRHKELASSVETMERTPSFVELFFELGLDSEYWSYTNTVKPAFDDIVCNVPVADFSSKNELIKQLLSVVDWMRSQAGTDSTLLKHYSHMPYNIVNGQDFFKDSSLAKPDVLLTFNDHNPVSFSDVHICLKAETDSSPGVYRNHIGELADYAQQLWKCHPTRKVVFTLFLRGNELDLFAFTHNGYFKAPVGPVLFADDYDKDVQSREIKSALWHLWFLLTLPANRLRFLSYSYMLPEYLTINSSTIPATMEEADAGSDGSVLHLRERIPCYMRITGRCAYLFKASYEGKEVVLKMGWSRANRIPEGAIYRVLKEHAVSNIPEIFASGLLVEDFDGFHLEYLVMQDCGVSIVDHFQRKLQGLSSTSSIAAEVKLYVKHVVSTLTEALAVGALHRDISAGNITIKDGKAYVIDWGCAKLLCEPANAALYEDVAERWRFNWYEAIEREKDLDKYMGTPLYMSNRVLLEADTRGIYDDLESLFYVILDALSIRSQTAGQKDQPPGFAYYDKNMAYTRLMCTQLDDDYLRCFGVCVGKSMSLELKHMLNAMRRFLFFRDGVHIGVGVLTDVDFSRTFDGEAAAVFMGNDAACKLMWLTGGQAPQSPAPRASSIPSPFAPEIARIISATSPRPKPVPLSLPRCDPLNDGGNDDFGTHYDISFSARPDFSPSHNTVRAATPVQTGRKRKASHSK